MNWQKIEGNWNLIKGKVREQWADLTDNDLEYIAGRRQQLVGRIQRTYGLMMDEAERRVQEWEARFRDWSYTPRRIDMMKSTLGIAGLTALLLLDAGCARENQGPVDQAIDKTKDALDMRDHEKLRDAAESAKDAAHEAADGLKQEVKDATGPSSH